MDIVISPGKLSGRFKAPDSKSDLHRKLICAALSGEKTLIEADVAHICADVRATADSLRELGAGIRKVSEREIEVAPLKIRDAVPCLNCMESGSTLRFLLPVASVLYDEVFFTGRGKLPMRPLDPLLRQMRSHGASSCGNILPFAVKGRLGSGEYILPGNISSQFVSGLLFALPLLGEKSVVILASPPESSAYIDMTIDVLRQFSVEIVRSDDRFIIPKGARYVSPGVIGTEGDWSGSAFFIAAKMMGCPVECTGLNMDSLQPDSAVIGFSEIFKPCFSSSEEIVIDVSQFPDLVPVLAILACGIKGKTLIENAGRLRLKESDRIASVADMIKSLGGKAEVREGSMLITGCGSLTGGEVLTYNDHRIAMAASVASVLCGAFVTVRDAHVVEKSYPAFFDDFKNLGGKFYVV